MEFCIIKRTVRAYWMARDLTLQPLYTSNSWWNQQASGLQLVVCRGQKGIFPPWCTVGQMHCVCGGGGVCWLSLKHQRLARTGDRTLSGVYQYSEVVQRILFHRCLAGISSSHSQGQTDHKFLSWDGIFLQVRLVGTLEFIQLSSAAWGVDRLLQ